jgi:two-component system sensor histidine kinase/response regulator
VRTNQGTTPSGRGTLGKILPGIGIALFCLIGLFSPTLIHAQTPDISLDFSDEEKTWLQQHETVRVYVGTWPPFHYMDNGKPKGLALDYVDAIFELVGLEAEFVPTLWHKALENISKSEKIDMLPTIAWSKEREKVVDFTEPYLTFPYVIFTAKDAPPVGSLEDLHGKTVAVVKEFIAHQRLRKEDPEISLFVLESPKDALEAVSLGKADAYVGNLAVGSSLIEKHGLVNLKVAAQTRYEADKQSMGVRKDWPELASILNKALKALPAEAHREIRSKWLQIDTGDSDEKKLVLTDKEKAWLLRHKDIRLGVDPAWPPFEFSDATRVYSGIASDYVRLLNEKLGVNMVPVPDLTWPQVMDKVRAREIDVLPCVVKTPERSKFMLFTKPYLSFPVVILTREDAPFVNGVEDFENNKVAVVKGYATQEFLERKYPLKNFYLAGSIDDAIQAVSKGKVDAYVGNLASITYSTQRLGLTNLKVATTTPYKFELAFAVRKDWRALVNVLNNAMDSLSDAERTRIHDRWINVRFEERTDWTAIFGIVGAVVLVGGLILFIIVRWNRRLAKEVVERKRAEERSRLILESAGEGIFGVGEDGLVNFVNPAGVGMLGFEAEELMGQQIHPLVHHTRPDGTPYPVEECPMYRTLTEGAMSKVDDEVLWRKDGTGFPVEYTSVPVRKDGSIAGSVIVFRDITERKEAEEAMKNSEQRLAEIIDFLPDPTWVVDNDGKVVTWNRAIEKLLGVKADDIVGKGNYEYALPFYGERRPVLIDLVREWDEQYEKEYLSIKKDGRNLTSQSYHPHLGDGGMYLNATASLLYDASGDVVGTIESLRDITQAKRSELELKKLSRAIEQSPASVVITDPEGVIEYVNPKFTEVTGYTEEEAIGGNPRILKSGQHDAAFYKEMWETILAGDVWRGEIQNRKKSGELYWESCSIAPILDAAGKIAHFVAVKNDVTERKRMEEELIQARIAADEANKAKGDFLANMSHEIRTPMNAVIGMSHLALKTELTPKQRDYLNKIQSSANSLLGIINDILDFSKIEAGKLDMESVDFNLDRVLDNLANLITVKAQEKENLEVLFSTGREVPRRLVGDPLRLGQVLTNLSNNAVKFTETGEIVISAELLHKEEEGVRLKFSVADSGIGLTKEQMSRLFQSFSQADTSTTRQYGGTGLGLAISKRLVEMMGGEIWVESVPGEGSTFSFTATFGYGEQEEKKCFTPSLDLRGMKVLVVDDNATSREIFRDMLMSFSFKVTLAASGKEGLSELESAPADDPFQLVVMDWSMPGMDGIEASRRIKEHSGLTKIPAIILVTAYGREEVMQQAEQVGVEGFLLKPVSPSLLFDTTMQAFGKEMPRESQVAVGKEEAARALEEIKGRHVLLAEDNEINQQVAKEILEGAGLKVSVANNGREALNAVKEHQYDAVLMDVQMPVMDGYAATREIRKLESGNRNVPIVAMTAHAMAGDEEKSLDAGMNGHVTKPIDPEQLFSVLGKWIQSGKGGDADVSREIEVSPEPGGAAGTFPESMPGFDLAAGLKRLGGNRNLYRKLLLSFAADYRGAPEEIRDALAVKEMDRVKALVHTLKGVAGNLAATELQTATAELEKLFKEDEPGKDPSTEMVEAGFTALEEALNRVLASVEKLGDPAADEGVESSSGAMPPASPALTPETVARIRDAVEVGDVTELTEIAEELRAESEALAPFCDRIIKLAGDFDFDSILRMINEREGSDS